jgi:predicted RNase H-like nuclease (RuvC/YqgF family)
MTTQLEKRIDRIEETKAEKSMLEEKTLRLEEKIDNLAEKLDEFKKDLDKRLDAVRDMGNNFMKFADTKADKTQLENLERRLDAIEKNYWKFLGGFSVVMFLISLFANKIVTLIF